MTPRRLSPICLALLIALAALLPAGAPAAGSPARAWLTTGDGANLLAEQPAGALGAPMPDAPTISVDPTHSYQRIEASAPRSPTRRRTCSRARRTATRSCARSSIRAPASV
jgi:hypothetical protein